MTDAVYQKVYGQLFSTALKYANAVDLSKPTNERIFSEEYIRLITFHAVKASGIYMGSSADSLRKKWTVEQWQKVGAEVEEEVNKVMKKRHDEILAQSRR